MKMVRCRPKKYLNNIRILSFVKHNIMHKLIIISFVLFSFLAFGQYKPNPFAGENTDALSGNQYSSPKAVTEEQATVEAKAVPGTDGLPIDDYLPLLLLVGLAIIFYQKRAKKNTSFN